MEKLDAISRPCCPKLRHRAGSRAWRRPRGQKRAPVLERPLSCNSEPKQWVRVFVEVTIDIGEVAGRSRGKGQCLLIARLWRFGKVVTTLPEVGKQQGVLPPMVWVTPVNTACAVIFMRVMLQIERPADGVDVVGPAAGLVITT